MWQFLIDMPQLNKKPNKLTKGSIRIVISDENCNIERESMYKQIIDMENKHPEIVELEESY